MQVLLVWAHCSSQKPPLLCWAWRTQRKHIPLLSHSTNCYIQDSCGLINTGCLILIPSLVIDHMHTKTYSSLLQQGSCFQLPSIQWRIPWQWLGSCYALHIAPPKIPDHLSIVLGFPGRISASACCLLSSPELFRAGMVFHCSTLAGAENTVTDYSNLEL